MQRTTYTNISANYLFCSVVAPEPEHDTPTCHLDLPRHDRARGWDDAFHPRAAAITPAPEMTSLKKETILHVMN